MAARVDGAELVVTVTDDGTGIAAELLPRIFDLFVQGGQSSARPSGGLGIGLTLVRKIAELHGGKVHAESEGRGRGSRFTLRLPVDDNLDALELMAKLLEASGHEVVAASEGPGALAALDHFKPDLAILDIGLPVMDGYELAGHIRARLGGAAPGLIALTGYGQERDRLRSREAGFHCHLVKPVAPAELLRVISTISPKARALRVVSG